MPKVCHTVVLNPKPDGWEASVLLYITTPDLAPCDLKFRWLLTENWLAQAQIFEWRNLKI